MMSMFKKFTHLASLAIGVGFVLQSTAVFATPQWNQLLRDYKMSPEHHAFCYASENDDVKGANAHMKVRTASVSKLITTLWAVETLGPQYQYDTKLFVKKNEESFDIHIQGSKDIVFSKRKLFHLVNQLHHAGIDKIQTITFDDQTIAYAKAEEYIGSVLKITPERTAKNLFDYLHTEGWQVLLPVYKQYVNSTPAKIRERFQIQEDPKAFRISIGEVKPVEKAPFDLNAPEVSQLSLLSPMIEEYLKFLNIVSNNFMADQAFENLGGEKAFDEYIKEFLAMNFPDYDTQMKGFATGEAPIKMFTGSGLNTTREGSRVDNYATCAVVIKLIEQLKNKMEELDSKIEYAVAVPGSDGGTFRSRLNSPRLKNTMVAKTGTLFHTSALAGMASTKSGLQFFGVFHQLQGPKGNAMIVQNNIVRQLIDGFGGEAPFDYTPLFFYPVAQD